MIFTNCGFSGFASAVLLIIERKGEESEETRALFCTASSCVFDLFLTFGLSCFINSRLFSFLLLKVVEGHDDDFSMPTEAYLSIIFFAETRPQFPKYNNDELFCEFAFPLMCV